MIILSTRLLNEQFIGAYRVAARRRRVNSRNGNGRRIVIIRRSTVAAGECVGAHPYLVFITNADRVLRNDHLSASSAFLLANSASESASSARLRGINADLYRVRRAFFVCRVANACRRFVSVLLLSPLRNLVLPFQVAVQEVSARRVCSNFCRNESALLVIANVSANACRRFLIKAQRLIQVLLITIMILTRGGMDRASFFISGEGYVRFVVPSGLINLTRYRSRFARGRLLGEDRRIFSLFVRQISKSAVIATNCRSRGVSI